VSGTSGTYAFNPSLSDIMLDAYERAGILGVDLTVQNQRLASARRSMNFVLSSWANRGVNLWTVDQVAQYMPQGVSQYFDDASCIDILPDSVVLRQYQMGNTFNVTPNFSTTINSSIVTIAGFAMTPNVGQYIGVIVPVSIGGIVLQGFYQVLSVPASGQVTVQASASATSTVLNGGVVPEFTTTQGSQLVTVTFPNSGLLSGQAFQVQVQPMVGGITLSGQYPVSSPTSGSFSILAPYAAGFAQSVFENGGLARLSSPSGSLQFFEVPQYETNDLGQLILDDQGHPILIAGDDVVVATGNSGTTGGFVDLLLYPLSRGDYQAVPDKAQQGRPTSFWINRQVVPVFNIWLVPDQNGPYELRYYRSRQVQDSDIVNGLQAQVPYRFLESYVADIAAHLAMKFAPDRVQTLASYAQEQWVLASEEDREKVSTFLVPDFSGYFS